MKRILLALGILTGAALSVPAQDYAIKMNFPLQANQRYQYTARGTQTTENAVPTSTEVLKTDLRVELESTVTVLEVDPKGRPIKESHTVGKLISVKDTAKENLLPAGTKVVAFQTNKKMAFEVGDKPVATKVQKALELVINLGSEGPAEEEVFGTTERKKVGDSWDINAEVALKHLQGKGRDALKPEKITGRTTLQKVTKTGEVEVIHLTGNMSVRAMPDFGIPVSDASGNMETTMTGAIPADKTKVAQVESITMTVVVKASMQPRPDVAPMKINTSMKQAINLTRQLLK